MKTKIYLQFRWLLLCYFLLSGINMMAGGTDYYYKPEFGIRIES